MPNPMHNQASLFDEPSSFPVSDRRSEGDALNLRDADVTFFPRFFSPARAAEYLARLHAETAWRQDRISIYGKDIALPRLTAWYGEPNKIYTFSGIEFEPLPFTGTLLEIKREIETATGETFNSVLLNFYRDGSDSIAPHADDEPELGLDPAIGSVSFGAARRFVLRHKTDKSLKSEILLTDGSFLLMRGATQRFWLHSLPKTAKPTGPRINLTFRSII